MVYMGSKNRHAHELLNIILKNRKSEQYYVEPFVGGFNMIDKVTGNRIANDSNFYLIELFKAIINGYIPPKQITEFEYDNIKCNKEIYPPCLVGFVGFCCSYSGKFFGGYARGKNNKGLERNYCLERFNNLIKQRDSLIGCEIYNLNYKDLIIPKNSIIYCDPPYANTTGYSSKFDHDEFWDWCREQKLIGHDIYISEYYAPNDFTPIWEKKVNNSLTKDTGSKIGIEKLFVYKK